MELLIIVLLTILNAIFAMSEMALAASRHARLEAMAHAGNQGASVAMQLMDNPTHFLSTVQVGITSIGVLNGIFGEAAFSPVVAAWLQQWGVAGKAAGVTATALVVTIITFTTIIFGELVPKRIGQLFPEAVASWVARPMALLARLAKPFVILLAAVTQGVLRLLRIDTTASRQVTEEEIAASLEEGVDAGLIEEHEHEMVQNVFQLDDRILSSMMIPRADVVWFDAHSTVAEALSRLSEALQKDPDGHIHSWYPVCKGSLDRVEGIVSVGCMLGLGSSSTETLADIAQPATFIPETLSGMELLEQFRMQANRLIFIVDEYGEVQGIMTPRDLLEAITGELKPETYQEAWAFEREDGSWLLDGLIPINELKKRLDIEELPSEDRDHYNTLAGLLMFVLGDLPQLGQKIECVGWRFEIIDMDGKRIDKVLASRLPKDQNESSES